MHSINEAGVTNGDFDNSLGDDRDLLRRRIEESLLESGAYVEQCLEDRLLPPFPDSSQLVPKRIEMRHTLLSCPQCHCLHLGQTVKSVGEEKLDVAERVDCTTEMASTVNEGIGDSAGKYFRYDVSISVLHFNTYGLFRLPGVKASSSGS